MTPMVVQCPSCLTEFELDPIKVPSAGVRARCSVCSAVIVVPAPPAPPAPPAATQEAEPVSETHQAPTAEAKASEATAPASAPEPEPETERPEQPQPVAQREPDASQPPLSYAAPAAAGPPEPPAAPEAPEAPEATRAHELPPAPVSRSPWTVPPPPVPVPSPAPSAAPAAAPVSAHSTTATPETPATDAGQRRPINPFLTRDPALRAKRLARALVSDIVAYHPARHAEGLRDGSLKTLFRDEIKKSYEEYVDQVGRDFAGSTTHFQDALNDVLASGRKLF